MKVLKPWIQIKLVEEKKTVIILDKKDDLYNQRVVVEEAYEGSEIKKGDTLFLMAGTKLQINTKDGADMYFVHEGNVMGVE